jgi:hypothetical protein
MVILLLLLKFQKLKKKNSVIIYILKMLLHRKRIQGGLMGIGYQNPYALESHLHIEYMQPLRHGDHVRNLNLVPEDIDENLVMRMKDDYNERVGSGSILNSYQPSLLQMQRGGAIGVDDVVMVSETAKKIYQGLKKVGKFYSSKTGTKMKNYWGKNINPHPNFRPGFVGENHMILDGTVANFLGPGSQIKKRVQRMDPPLDGTNGLDAQARIHDIDYMNAKSIPDIRRADKKLMKNLRQAKGSRIVKKMAMGSIRAKMKAEDLGLLAKDYFNKIDIAENQDTQLVGEGKSSKLKKVRQMGKYPDSYIRQKLMKQYKLSKKKLIKRTRGV